MKIHFTQGDKLFCCALYFILIGDYYYEDLKAD